MKKITGWIVTILMIVACLCVWPFSLVRKAEILYPNLEGSYAATETIAEGTGLAQKFIAQTSYLESMAIDLQFAETRENGGIIFQIQDQAGKVIFEKELFFADINNGSFTDITIEKWVKKGDTYSYHILVEEEYEGILWGICTTLPEDASPGNVELSCNGALVDGQLVTKYVYRFPLNIKNVLCLWGFIGALGFAVLRLLGGEGSGKLTEKVRRMEKKLDELLERFGLPILGVTALGIVALIVRICMNEAVHWDEAYTWNLITQMSIPEMIDATAKDIHPPLYYLIVRFFVTVFGQTIFVAKMASLAGTVVAMILGMTLIRKRWGTKAALPFMLVIGLGTQFIYYNVDVRMYSWTIVFVLAAALFGYELVLEDKWYYWVLFVLTSLCGVYTQYFAVIPLVVIYFYVVTQYFKYRRNKVWKWFAAGVATVIGYLPWLFVLIDIFKRESSYTVEEEAAFSLGELCEWAFSNNIVFSEFTPLFLFGVAIVLFIVNRKKYNAQQRGFLILTASILVLTDILCMIVAGGLGHFWSNRYIVDALIFVWIFMAIIWANSGLASWCCMMVWLTISVLSSYTLVKAGELNTIPWVSHAKGVLEQVQDEDQIVYSMVTYDIFYKYYVPNAEFVWYEDVDFANWPDEDFYMIAWGPNWFSWDLIEQYGVSAELVESMRFEQGITAELYKVTFHK